MWGLLVGFSSRQHPTAVGRTPPPHRMTAASARVRAARCLAWARKALDGEYGGVVGLPADLEPPQCPVDPGDGARAPVAPATARASRRSPKRSRSRPVASSTP